MKLFLTLAFLLITANIYGQETSLNDFHDDIYNRLKPWTESFVHFQLSDFKRSENRPFQEYDYDVYADWTSFYNIYAPILYFSEDSSHFIDIYSYQWNLSKTDSGYEINGEVDQATFLCPAQQNKCPAITFHGPGQWIEDVVWVSDTVFILVGIDRIEGEKGYPYIMVGNMEKRIFAVFTNKNKSCVQKKAYYSPVLKKIKIIGL